MARAVRWLRQDGWSYLFLPLVVYVTIITFTTWPLITQLSTHVVSGGLPVTDDVEHLRMIWWIKYALQHGLNPFYQSLFGYPDGFFSVVQWAQPLVYWPPALLGFFVNEYAAFNLWTLIVLVLNGLTAYWLCLDLLSPGAKPRSPHLCAALFGSTVFMIFPALQGHLLWGQLNIISNYGLPILVLCLNRILTGRGDTRLAVVGALAIWAMLLSNYTSLIFLLLPLVLFGGSYWLLFRRRELLALRWRGLSQIALVFIGGALLSLPFYLPMISEALDPAKAAYLQTQGAGWTLFSADLLSFAALSPFTPWTEAIAPQFSYTILNTNITEGAAYLGIVALLLAITAIFRQHRITCVWLVIMLGSMIFSLGPFLKWQEQPITYTLGLDKSNIVLPWAFFQQLPLVNMIRTPGRFNIMTGFALAILATFGLARLLERIRQPQLAIVLTGVLLVVTVGEYQLRFPFPTYSVTPPDYFRQLADRGDIRAVFDVPYTETHKEALLEQMEHHKPIIAGYYSRLTPVDPAKLMLLSEVARGRAWQAETTQVSFPGASLAPDTVRSVLKDNGIDVVVYHWSLLDRAATLAWATQVFGPPAYLDDSIAAFEVPAPSAPSNQVVMTHEALYWWPFTPPDYGWWPSTFDQKDLTAGSSGNLWLKSGARLVVYSPKSSLQHVTLKLTPLLKDRTLNLTLNGAPLDSWTINAPSDQIDLWLPLRPGFQTLVFDVPEGCTPVPVAPICLADTSLQTNARAANPMCQRAQSDSGLCVTMQVTSIRSADAGVLYEETQIMLGNGMTLQGFRVPDEVHRGDVLPIETDWYIAKPLTADYHLFIHIVDSNGNLVLQHDGVPGNGTYPTTTWNTPRDTSEVITIPIDGDVAPGIYEVYAGWYSYPDLMRVKVQTDWKGAIDGLIYLKTITIN